ncbi:hypothetical protein [Streptomyces chartreusis]
MLTGDRPTGPLRFGHYFSTLLNPVLLQEHGVEMFVIIARYQVLTDHEVASNLPCYVDNLVADYLARAPTRRAAGDMHLSVVRPCGPELTLRQPVPPQAQTAGVAATARTGPPRRQRAPPVDSASDAAGGRVSMPAARLI